ncbi:hypothetical protein ABH899_001306 [Paenibacillus sp. RC84]
MAVAMVAPTVAVRRPAGLFLRYPLNRHIAGGASRYLFRPVSLCFRFNSSTGLGTVGLLHPLPDQLPFPALLLTLAYLEGRPAVRRNLR